MMVITYSGKKVDKKKCRLIKGEYYQIGDPNIKDSGDCYPLKNKEGKHKYYRINSGYIEWDYEQQQYVIKSECILEYGFVDKNTKGFFTKNLIKNITIRTESPAANRRLARNSEELCISEEVAIMNGGFLSPIDGFYYILEGNKRNIKEYELWHNNHRNFYGKINYQNFTEQYNITSDKNALRRSQEVYAQTEIEVSKEAKLFHRLLDGLSFGYEVETSSGRVLEKDLFKYGVIPLRDGSTSNHEYTSIPYSSPKDVQAYFDMFEIYNKMNRTDQSCSLHYHIGNFLENFSREDFKLNLIAIYLLYYYLQKEIWAIMPPYKKSNDYFKTKRDFKDHCQDLNSLGLVENRIYTNEGELDAVQLNQWFNILFRFLNDGVPLNEYNNLDTRKHYKHGDQKWHIDSRYYALNLYNALFSNSYTVEFRAHSGTVSKDKATAWLLLCVGLIRFAIKYRKEIIMHNTKFFLTDIVEEFRNNFGKNDVGDYGEFVADYLNEYILSRKRKFLNAFFEKDIYAKEFDEDNIYSFKHKNMTLYGWEKK